MKLPSETSEPASRLLHERVRTLFRHLPKSLSGDEESIHQMRVAGRRLRVALRLLVVNPGGRRVRRCLRALRDLVSRGGGSRDLDVGLSLLEQRVAETGPPDPAVRQLRSRLRAARTRDRARMAEDLLDQNLARLRRDLRALLRRGGEGLFAVLVRIRGERDCASSELAELLASTAAGFRPDVLHRLRRRARRLRYVAEVADLLRGQTSEAPALFRDLQDGLGRVHDAYVLSRWFARQAERAQSRGANELLAAAREMESHFLKNSRRLYGELIAQDPASMVRRGLDAMGARPAA